MRIRTLFLIPLMALPLLLLACSAERGNGPLSASGFVEGTEVRIAPEVGGRVAEVLVDEGDEVIVGQVLVRLDDALMRTRRGEAEAAVAAARANLARVRAGARPAEIAAARAALAQAEAEREGARRALENAQQAFRNPQDLNLQIAEAQTQVRLAEQEVERARAELGAAESRYGPDDFRTRAARAALEAAQAKLDGAQRYLEVLQSTRERPLALLAQVHAAEARYRAAEAAVEAARAALEKLEAGPTPEEVALAEAQLHQAEAALALIDAQLAQLTLVSPITGTVATRSVHPGETVAPGTTLLTLTNLDEVKLVLYISESQIGRIQVGQRVEVTVDSFPGRIFVGHVASIGSEAEFTPRSVQTREERVNLVFAVRVVIPNPDHALKPGMPADAVFRMAGP
ncbi:MAG: efflux RND transporter periplasmic adaptor subunit [Anaerolineae bacterium]|nr:efflux RND transporter periplasmic adaptor subunit [Anaerolineae bacterium]MDW7990880.1 efflux RND transporter periplasmic adaptor subunit [Anaerolineae bacterium]